MNNGYRHGPLPQQTVYFTGNFNLVDLNGDGRDDLVMSHHTRTLKTLGLLNPAL